MLNREQSLSHGYSVKVSVLLLTGAGRPVLLFLNTTIRHSKLSYATQKATSKKNSENDSVFPREFIGQDHQEWRFPNCSPDGLLDRRSDYRLDWLCRGQDTTPTGQRAKGSVPRPAGLHATQQLLLRCGYRGNGGQVFP